MPTSFLLSYMDNYVAKEGKFWEKEGLDVELVIGTGSASAISQVSNKTAFAARGAAITTIISRATQNLPLRSVYPAHRDLQFVLVTNASAKIIGPADMRGKSLGVISRNGSTEQFLTLILANAGIKKEEWTPVLVGEGNNAYSFLEKGQVAAYVATDQAGLELQYNHRPVLILPMSDFLQAPSGDMTVHQDSIKDDPDTVMRFVRGLHNARKWALDPANIDKILSYCKVYVPDELKDAELAKLKIGSDLRLWTGSKSSLKMGQIDKTGWTNLQDQLFTAGFISKKLDLSELIDTSFMEKVEP
jgi:NitT/TauT family transport system substrate-binding protein